VEPLEVLLHLSQLVVVLAFVNSLSKIILVAILSLFCFNLYYDIIFATMKNYNLQLFNELDDTFLHQINMHAKMVQFKKGDLPFFDEELEKHFYFIIEGRIKSYQLHIDSLKEQTIFIYRRGDMLDTITLLDAEPHELLYKALENTNALQIPIEKVREWIDTNKEFKAKFFPYIAMQMRHTEELATDIALEDTATRLHKLLLANKNPKKHFYYELLQKLSNTEIANLTGTVRHVIERHFKTIKEQKSLQNPKKMQLK
jgi:CRP-like cAMP-binding protein